ncbi:MAG TPA: site-2 protease family protein [Candidatus Bathyarchaeia archaeon]
MSDISADFPEPRNTQQADFEKITLLVTSEFQIEESIIEQDMPTYYLKWPQETKQAFLRLLRKLEKINMVAFLRKANKRVVLKVVGKPLVKPSNPWTYWILFLATIATTFVTGYFLLPPEAGLDPFVSGAIFSASIMTVLGLHEMGHKLTANKNKVEATSPYFVPGPPPLGTLGAVIVQKSLPPNRDALFDIGSNGPIAGFVVALIFSAIGIALSIPGELPPGEFLEPLSWIPMIEGMSSLNLIPQIVFPNNGLYLHPVAYAGWAGMIVTMLNLLPAAMLDGGHVAKSLVPDRYRYILTIVSVVTLVLVGREFWIFALIVVFMSSFKHPGPLDDVSGLSRNRKLVTIGLLACLILSFPIRI